MKKEEAKQLNGLVLAYMGDTVFESFVREIIIAGTASGHVIDMHKNSIKIVNCKTQSKFIDYLDEFLTDEEKYIIKRGQNTKSHSVPKNADRLTYQRATGFEALIGYLHLSEQTERLGEIFDRLRPQIETILKETKK